MTRQILQILLALLVLVLGAACAAESPSEPTSVPLTATPLPTNTSTLTPSPLPTNTSTLTPSPLPTNTSTLTPSPLPTATYTLPPAPTETIPSTETGTPAVAAFPTTIEQESPAAVTGEGDIARGQVLFATNRCDSCHDISNPYPGGEYGPNLGNISTEALNVIALPDYKGAAANAAEYIRESVLMPNIYIVPGPNYIDAPGVSVMTQDFGESIPPQDLNDLITYLLSLDAK